MAGGACARCHASKIKCDKLIPCTQCVKRGFECHPHVSRQGQGTKKRKREQQSEQKARESVTENTMYKGTTSLDKNHYGLHHMIRQWFSYAFTRRSISLLNKASALACRCNLSMDEIFCAKPLPDGWPSEQPMNFLPNVIVKEGDLQITHGPRLRWEELPIELLSNTFCIADHQDSDINNLGDRWIYIREMNKGKSRFFVSPAFERDVCAWPTIQKTWIENIQEVTSLWYTDEQVRNYGQALIQQIANFSRPDSKMCPTRLSGTRINTINGGQVKVDSINCLMIIDLDKSIYYQEYIPCSSKKGADKDPLLIDKFAEIDWNEELDAWVDNIM